MPNQSSPPLPVHRSDVRRFWLKFSLCFLGLLLLPVVFYLEENWLGARAWAACQRDLQAQGESLDWKTFVPPRIPDENNLAMAPLFIREFRYRADLKSGAYTFGDRSTFPEDLKYMPYVASQTPQNLLPAGWDLARHRDLAGVQRYYRQYGGLPFVGEPQTPAADVLLGLSRYAPALDELSKAATARPLTRFPLDWSNDNLTDLTYPHLFLEQKFVVALCLRATAQLALGQAEESLRDIELSLRLCRDMPVDGLMMITHLVECVCLRQTLNPVWEGLADRRWYAAQLARLQADLQRLDVLADYLAAIRGERVFLFCYVDYYKKQRDGAALLMIPYGGASSGRPGPGGIAQLIGDWAPPGWYDSNKAVIARFEQDYFIKAVDMKTRRLMPDHAVARARAFEAMTKWPTAIVAKMVLPIMDPLERRSARAQTGLDQAVVACALERFFLDRHAYPARLDELAPTYLERVPTDIIDGAPMRYRPMADGRYQLYSVGWNVRDDGGKVVWDSPRRLKDDEGDWVWQYSELQPPAPAETK